MSKRRYWIIFLDVNTAMIGFPTSILPTPIKRPLPLHSLRASWTVGISSSKMVWVSFRCLSLLNDSRKTLGSNFAGRPVKNPEGADGQINPSNLNPLSGLAKTAQKILNRQKQDSAPTLFLGNLGFETTEDSIRELFEAHRNFGKRFVRKRAGKDSDDEENSVVDIGIRKVRMGTFEDSGKCKGWVYMSLVISHCSSYSKICLRRLYEHRACTERAYQSSESSLEREESCRRICFPGGCTAGRGCSKRCETRSTEPSEQTPEAQAQGHPIRA